MKNAISQDEVDFHYFCAQENLSFSMGGTDWLLDLQQEKKVTVREKTQNEKNKRLKNKKHHGPFNSYNINKEALENKLASMSLNRPINWTRLE